MKQKLTKAILICGIFGGILNATAFAADDTFRYNCKIQVTETTFKESFQIELVNGQQKVINLLNQSQAVGVDKKRRPVSEIGPASFSTTGPIAGGGVYKDFYFYGLDPASKIQIKAPKLFYVDSSLYQGQQSGKLIIPINFENKHEIHNCTKLVSETAPTGQ